MDAGPLDAHALSLLYASSSSCVWSSSKSSGFAPDKPYCSSGGPETKTPTDDVMLKETSMPQQQRTEKCTALHCTRCIGQGSLTCSPTELRN